MHSITKKAWAEVQDKAFDIVNASAVDDDVMVAVYKEQLFEVLDRLEARFGIQPALIATRADFMEDDAARRKLYEQALAMAREEGDEFEVQEILDSLQHLDADQG